jgi:hypothetical protein
MPKLPSYLGVLPPYASCAAFVVDENLGAAMRSLSEYAEASRCVLDDNKPGFDWFGLHIHRVLAAQSQLHGWQHFYDFVFLHQVSLSPHPPF